MSHHHFDLCTFLMSVDEFIPEPEEVKDGSLHIVETLPENGSMHKLLSRLSDNTSNVDLKMEEDPSTEFLPFPQLATPRTKNAGPSRRKKSKKRRLETQVP